LNALSQYPRLIGKRNTRVNVQHVGTGFNLRQGIRFDSAIVAAAHLFCQTFATCGVDPLAYNAEWLIKAYANLAFGRTN
jgi:hypothetical protein